MSKQYIEIETLQSGQPRPYADHEYVKVLTFKIDDYRKPQPGEEKKILPLYVAEKEALAYARIACPWKDRDDPKACWADRFLVSFERLDPTPRPLEGYARRPTEDRSDRWRVHVRAAFTD